MPARSIDVNVDFDAMSIRRYYAEHKRQMPFAMSKAINDVAYMIKDDWGAQAKRVFENPVPLTQKPGYVYKTATKANLSARVGLKDFVAKGTAPNKYLYAQVYGGHRASKRSENALRLIGAMDPGDFIIPVKDSAASVLDSYGNVKKGLMTQILSDLRAFQYSGAQQNRAVGKAARYFAIRYKGQSGNLSPGVYKRVKGQRPIKVLHFVKGPFSYRKRFYYFETAEKRVKKSMNERFAHHFLMAARIINRNAMRRADAFRRERLALVRNTGRLR